MKTGHMSKPIKELMNLMSSKVSRGYVGYDTETSSVIAMLCGRIMTYLEFKEIWVDEFSVHPDYQRMNIGSNLLTFVREEMGKEDEKVSGIALTTERGKPSVLFYEKNGIHVEEDVIFMSGRIGV
jgi:aminoglycoside 6'-N-acetyltransferase I